MNRENIELLAAYFTIAGDVHPFGPTELSPFKFADRVEAAAQAGYKGIGMVHNDLMATIDKIGYAEIRRILSSNGIKHLEFEFLTDWYVNGEARRASDKIRRELMEAASELNPVNIKIGPSIGVDHADIPLMIEGFAGISQDAAKVGTNIALEIMPFSNVRTIETALAIVQGANQPNGGLLLDIWHLSRGGIDFNEIKKIPSHFIRSIELDDADKYAIEPLWQDTIHKRRLPGDGVLDLPGFIKAIQETGYNGHWGVEVLSEVLRKMPLQQMAQLSYDKTIAQFRE